MNTLKVHCLLKQRYSAHFLDVIQNITRPVFGTPCSYSNTVMKSPLREKIQNAINRAIDSNHSYSDCNNNGEGALIVGGRRRNRKKKNKKNGQKKKKSPTVDLKTRLSPSRCRKAGTEQDSAPLIETGAGDLGEDNHVENKENEKMVFDFLKKKKNQDGTPKETEVSKKGDAPVVNGKESVAGEKEDAAPTQPKASEDSNPSPQQPDSGEVKEEVVPKDSEAERVTAPSKEVQEPVEEQQPVTYEMELNRANGKTTVTFNKDTDEVQTVAEGDNQPAEPITKKSEKSPLIGKKRGGGWSKDGESTNVKDSQPGFLCCAIL